MLGDRDTNKHRTISTPEGHNTQVSRTVPMSTLVWALVICIIQVHLLLVVNCDVYFDQLFIHCT